MHHFPFDTIQCYCHRNGMNLNKQNGKNFETSILTHNHFSHYNHFYRQACQAVIRTGHIAMMTTYYRVHYSFSATIFQNFTGLENSRTKFQDFPGPVQTLKLSSTTLQTPRYYGQNSSLPPVQSIEVWLKMTLAIADSRYYGLQTTSRGCPL